MKTTLPKRKRPKKKKKRWERRQGAGEKQTYFD